MLQKDDLLKILTQHDPIDLVFEDIKNTDEYSPEANSIHQKLSDCQSESDVRALVDKVFEEKFGTRVLAEKAKLSDISKDIWSRLNN